VGEGVGEEGVIAALFDVLVLVGEVLDCEGFLFDLVGTPDELC
jgi:hypothetical protein